MLLVLAQTTNAAFEGRDVTESCLKISLAVIVTTSVAANDEGMEIEQEAFVGTIDEEADLVVGKLERLAEDLGRISVPLRI